MDVLKPCPFCGSTNVLYENVRVPLPDWEDKDDSDWFFRCYGCRTDFILHNAPNSKDGAIKRWNKRCISAGEDNA